jgi:hypothetical protein
MKKEETKVLVIKKVKEGKDIHKINSEILELKTFQRDLKFQSKEILRLNKLNMDQAEEIVKLKKKLLNKEFKEGLKQYGN